MVQDFKNLKVWKIAHALTKEVYILTVRFPANENYGLTSQLRRAASSISSNIAEGCGRSKKELANFLRISLGSSKECENHIILAKDLGYLEEPEYLSLACKVDSISAMLTSLISRVSK